LSDFYAREFSQHSIAGTGRLLGPKAARRSESKGFHPYPRHKPHFSGVAVVSRLSWIGASVEDFAFVTTMDNSRFSKPNLRYYGDIFDRAGKRPEECLMVGNNALEDMCVSALGSKVFWLPITWRIRRAGTPPPTPRGSSAACFRISRIRLYNSF
jgi:hypothetical protein